MRIDSKEKANAIRIYGITPKLSRYQGSYILNDGRLLDMDDSGHWELFARDFGFKTNSLRIRAHNKELNIDFLKDRRPTTAQINTLLQISQNRHIIYNVVNREGYTVKQRNGMYIHGSYESFEEMLDKIDNYYSIVGI